MNKQEKDFYQNPDENRLSLHYIFLEGILQPTTTNKHEIKRHHFCYINFMANKFIRQ